MHVVAICGWPLTALFIEYQVQLKDYNHTDQKHTICVHVKVTQLHTMYVHVMLNPIYTL